MVCLALELVGPWVVLGFSVCGGISEKEMATHSSTLAWRIPRMWEPGGLPSMESHRVELD